MKMINTLDGHTALQISDITLGDPNKEDYAIWDVESNGHYTNKSVWQHIKSKKQKN